MDQPKSKSTQLSEQMDYPVRKVHTCVFGSSYHRIEVPGKLFARQVRADVDDDVVVQLDRSVQ